MKNRLFTRIITALVLISMTVFLAGGSLRMAFASETDGEPDEGVIAEETVDSSMEDPEFSEPETGEEPQDPEEEDTEDGELEEDVPEEQEADPGELEETEEADEDSSEDALGETEEETFDSVDPEDVSDEYEEDDFFVTDEEYSEEDYIEEDELSEEDELAEEEEEEEVPQFAGETGTTDFETLPLLDLGTEELKVCAFCTGKGLGKVQMAVFLAYLTAYEDSLDCTANDGAGILASAGIAKKDYSAWCKKKELTKKDLNNQLEYLYSVLFREAGPDTTVSMFKKSKSVKPAATAFYSMARVRNIQMPYSKEEITETIIPAAQEYLELFMLGGEKREGTAGVAYYCQGNYANVPYDEGTVADSGCGITAFSMVASELTGLNLGPEVTASWAYPNGVDTVTNWGAYWWLAKRFGVEFLGQYSGDFDLAVQALKEGNLVIASIRQDGFFTTSSAGHYILLTGIEEDGRICVNDPASYDRSVYGPFEYEAVFGHCLQFWIFGRG